MSDHNNNQTIETRMIDTSNIISIYLGLSFLNTSFYHHIHMIPQIIIGYFLIINGSYLIYKWEDGYSLRIKHIKWSLIIMILVVIPLQIYSFTIKRTSIDLSILFVIIISNIIANVIVILVLICKKKGMEEVKKK